jgi:hypothetical protein
MPARCVSGTEVSQKRNAATQYPHPTHPARHPRHESDGRVAQGPDAASRDQKTNHNPHRHETPPIGPHSHQRPPHTPFAALHVYNGQYKDHRQFSAQWFCGIISIYLNHSARQIRGETMMVSSTRQLDWMWWSRRSHASEMSYRSSPDGVGPLSELAVPPTSSQRSRCPSTRSSLVRALQPRCVATIPHSQRHFTAPPPLISPCTASRAFNGEGRLTLGAWTTRRAAGGGQSCPAALTSSGRPSCDHSSTACVTCVPAGPRRSGLQQCQPRVVCATELRATAARFRLSAHRCGPCRVRWSTFSLNR